MPPAKTGESVGPAINHNVEVAGKIQHDFTADNQPPMNDAPGDTKPSYGQIFRSTAFTGQATVITLAFGVLRMKVLAILLGPAGVGLAGTYTNIISFGATLAGMGINNSGVRQIAEASAKGDARRVSCIITTISRAGALLGLLGTLLLVVFSKKVSELAFGDGTHASTVKVLAICVGLTVVSTAQTAIIQGLRRIADLAKITVIGAVAGTVLGLPIVKVLGFDGIVPMLLIIPAASIVCSWFVTRRLTDSDQVWSWQETTGEARKLLLLGFAFMASALMTAGVTLFVRLIVLRQEGEAAAGHFAAAYTLAGVYTGFLLQAMGADFYPRLTASASDDGRVNQLVNEQTEIALLIALPGVLGTIVCAPWIISAFYAADFHPAIGLLQWQVFGIFGRIVTWPMGFIMLAKGEGRLFLLTELVSNLVYTVLVYFGLRMFGLAGVGMAFLGLYLFYTVLMVTVSWRLTGFRWSEVNRKILKWSVPCLVGVFAAAQLFRPLWAIAVGVSAILTSGVVCLRMLWPLIPVEKTRILTARIVGFRP